MEQGDDRRGPIGELVRLERVGLVREFVEDAPAGGPAHGGQAAGEPLGGPLGGQSLAGLDGYAAPHDVFPVRTVLAMSRRQEAVARIPMASYPYP